jgi:hypothetical protein
VSTQFEDTINQERRIGEATITLGIDESLMIE